MCILTTSLTAGTLAAIGASSMAASTTAVAATTLAANAIIGAGLSAGVGAATGARGRDLWTAAAIGGATAGVLSGAGMALGGVSTVAGESAASGTQVMSNTGGLLTEASTTTTMNGETFVLQGTGENAHWVAAADLAKSGEAGAAAASAATATTEADTATYGMMAAQVGQGAFEGYASYQEAKEEAAALRDQARLNEIRAGQAQEAAGLEKIEQSRKTRQLVASQKTASAANGVMLETRSGSSPAMFEQDAQAELAWDNAKIDYNANLEAWGYMENARQQLKQAKSTRRTGNLKLATGLIKGGIGAAGSYFAGSQRATANRLYA